LPHSHYLKTFLFVQSLDSRPRVESIRGARLGLGGHNKQCNELELSGVQLRDRVRQLKRMLGQPPNKACRVGHKTSLCEAARDKKAAQLLTYYPVSRLACLT
jgi:hypothetical protein